jgi:serine/threonine protein kinase
VEMTAEQSDEVQLTRAGNILGSPYYMAPELAEGMANSSVASDLFSFGCIAYEIICGKRPFDKPLVFEGPAERKNRTAPPLRTLCPHVDEQLAKLIDRCLGPADARPSTEELLAAFSRGDGQAAATG